MKDVLLAVFGFFGGLIFTHVQKPLTEYRKTLTDISQLMLRSVHVLFEKRDKYEQASPEEKKLYDALISLHARLVSSSDGFSRFASPVIIMIGLLRSREQINEGARMLIDIFN